MFTNFRVFPYVGVGPIYFGMNRDQLHAILGIPDSSKNSRFGPKVIDYWHSNDITIMFSAVDGTALEIGFGYAQMTAEVEGIKLFERSGPEVYRDLCLLDGYPREDVGFTVLFKFGITLDGFLISDQEQRVVTVFSRGVWREYDPKLLPVKIT